MNEKSHAAMKILAIFLGEELMEMLICFLVCIIFVKNTSVNVLSVYSEKEIRYTDVAYLSLYRYCCRAQYLKGKNKNLSKHFLKCCFIAHTQGSYFIRKNILSKAVGKSHHYQTVSFVALLPVEIWDPSAHWSQNKSRHSHLLTINGYLKVSET